MHPLTAPRSPGLGQGRSSASGRGQEDLLSEDASDREINLAKEEMAEEEPDCSSRAP